MRVNTVYIIQVTYGTVTDADSLLPNELMDIRITPKGRPSM
jgi:hypothetical protein